MAAGASELTFNAITALNAAKALHKVAEAEGLPLLPEEAASIASCSGGALVAAHLSSYLFYFQTDVNDAGLRRLLSSPAGRVGLLRFQSDVRPFVSTKAAKGIASRQSCIFDKSRLPITSMPPIPQVSSINLCCLQKRIPQGQSRSG